MQSPLRELLGTLNDKKSHVYVPSTSEFSRAGLRVLAALPLTVTTSPRRSAEAQFPEGFRVWGLGLTGFTLSHLRQAWGLGSQLDFREIHHGRVQGRC